MSKEIAIIEGTADCSDWGTRSFIAESITEWNIVSDEDYEILSKNLDYGYYLITRMSETELPFTIENCLKRAKEKEERERADRLKKQERAKKAAETKARKKEEREKAQLEELKKKYE